jgi:hypothetical protein
MNRPKPEAPAGLPPGSIQIGGPIEWFKITLMINGPKLIPKEITKILGREPDDAWEKDQPIHRKDGRVKRVPKFGAWHAWLKPEDTDEWDCAFAMRDLLATLPSSAPIWHQLAKKYQVKIRAALLLPGTVKGYTSRGFALPPDLLAYLGERRVEAEFDVYCAPENNGPPLRGGELRVPAAP